MTYISLYRKWRSQNFDEIVGQRHIVQTLKNAISMGRIGHAYLFSGPRGTGKTSMARILAKALNCKENLCGKCDSCQKITEGSAIDVIEIDAASNRGIDEIRELREKIRYLPVEGKYKIYIIDEVHMLTQEAFNALLKTLEEPPEHVVFVLATTEPNRVPVTISSRCQRLDFERISSAEVKGRIIEIARSENVEVEDKALELIARAGEGSMRDSVSLLDQLISFSGSKITADQVVILLGGANEELLFRISGALLSGAAGELVMALKEAIDAGKSALQIARDIIVFYRNLLLVKLSLPDTVDAGLEHIKRLEEEAEKYELSRIKEILKAAAAAEQEMKWHPQGRILLEVALLELLGDRNSVTVTLPVSSNVNVERYVQSSAVTDNRITKIKKHWNDILTSVKKKSLFGYVSLHEGQLLEINDQGKLVIGFKKGFGFHKDRLEEQKVKTVVEEVIFEITGEKIGIICQVGGTENPHLSAQAVAEIFE